LEHALSLLSKGLKYSEKVIGIRPIQSDLIYIISKDGRKEVIQHSKCKINLE